MLGLSLKEGLLALFLVIACFKQQLIDQNGIESEPGQSLSTSGLAAETPQEKHEADTLQDVLNAARFAFTNVAETLQALFEVSKQPTHDKHVHEEAAVVQCELSAEWREAMHSQRPVVLQNMTNKAAYNGHVGKIRNCTKSRLLIGVHGVFFDAEPVNIWVKPWHIRLLEAPTPGKNIDMSQVKVRASSTRGDFSLQSVVEDDDSKWWISKPGSFSRGRGEEYLEFEFASSSVARVMGISIPPMPYGPLSVREFSVEAYVNGNWQPVSSRLQTIDRAGLQEVAIQLVKSRRLRLKCFASAAPMDTVGLFQISFK